MYQEAIAQAKCGLMGGCCLLQDAGSVFLLQSAEPPAVPSHPGPVRSPVGASWSPGDLSGATEARLPRGEGSPKPPPPGSGFTAAMDLDAELGS